MRPEPSLGASGGDDAEGSPGFAEASLDLDLKALASEHFEGSWQREDQIVHDERWFDERVAHAHRRVEASVDPEGPFKD